MTNPEHNFSKEEVHKLNEEISAISAEMQEKLQKHESRELRIPEKLYHVTKRSNVNQILQEGIDPSSLWFEESSEVVSLSDDIDFALSVARTTQNISAKDLAVLEIETSFLTPSRLDNYLRKEDPSEPNPVDAAAIHEVHYQSTIPPEAITVLK